MHKIAEYGIAAHWKYKENRNESNELDNKIQWLRNVMDTQSDATSSQEFYESLKLDLDSGQVFIFTPKGDVVPLPENSTPVDFAYYVHSEVGNKCIGAKVNNKMVPLETKLVTGDYVEIITSNNAKGPSRDWLRFVASSQAKSKIKAFFKKELKDDNIKRGKEMLEKEARNRGYLLADLMKKKWLDIVMQRYSISSIDDMYASIGYGGFTVNQILLKLIDFYNKELSATKALQITEGKKAKLDSNGIVIMGHDDLLVRVAKCCNPVPGDEIVGFISRGRGVAIHRKSCPNLKNIESFRLVDAQWKGNLKSAFVVALQIETKNTSGLLAEITKIIFESKTSINSLNARVDKHNNGIINLAINVTSMKQIEDLTSQIKKIPSVDKVFRSL